MFGVRGTDSWEMVLVMRMKMVALADDCWLLLADEVSTNWKISSTYIPLLELELSVFGGPRV